MDTGVGTAPARLIPHCVALIAGIVLVHSSALLPSFLQLLVLSAPAFKPWRYRSLWAAALLGILLAVLQAQGRLADRWPAARHGEVIELRGQVVSLPERAPGFGPTSPDTIRFEFAPQDPDLPDRIRVSWYEADQRPRGGECWDLELRMRTPRGSMNPGSFDYEGWLYRNGIGAMASVKDARRCGESPFTPVIHARQALVDHLRQLLANHPARPMIAALTVGDDSEFTDADWDLFRHTGTSHLVAISGFNVAIVAGVIFLVVRWMWPLSATLTYWLPAQKAGMIAAAGFGLLYGMLAGWDSPAQRAALMLALLLLAALPNRLASPWRVLALVAAVMLALDPASILSPGLWLSFTAVAAIFYASMGRLRVDKPWKLAIRIQLMLSIVLTPLSLYFFQGTTWLGIPVNLVAVPVMVIMTPAVVGAVVLGLAWPALGVPLLHGVADALAFLLSGLEGIAALAPAPWVGASPGGGACLLALLGSVLLFAPRGVPSRPLALLCFLPLVLPPALTTRPPFELTAMDVGQGLAVLVRTPHHSLLYDTGPAFAGGFDAGESVVVPSLLSQGMRHVDLLMLSHGDRDHAGGLDAVRRGVRVDREIGTEPDNACTAGSAWTWDGVHFEILHPEAMTDGSDNNQSCVLKISAGALSALLTGDIEEEAERALLARRGASLEADILIAPHHGSRTSSTPEFIAAVSPELVIFGAAWRSHFGHPHPMVVARYRASGATMLTTGVEGAIRLWRDPEGALQYEAQRRRGRRFWTAAPAP